MELPDSAYERAPQLEHKPENSATKYRVLAATALGVASILYTAIKIKEGITRTKQKLQKPEVTYVEWNAPDRLPAPENRIA